MSITAITGPIVMRFMVINIVVVQISVTIVTERFKAFVCSKCPVFLATAQDFPDPRPPHITLYR